MADENDDETADRQDWRHRYAAHACRARRRTPITASSIRRSCAPRPCSSRTSTRCTAAAGARYSYGLTNTPTIEALTDGAVRARWRGRHRARALRACRRHDRDPRRGAAGQAHPRARQRLCADAALLRRDPAGLRRRDGLLRPADRRRHRRPARRRLRALPGGARARTPSRCRTCRPWSRRRARPAS